jgi:O-antigen ligase
LLLALIQYGARLTAVSFLTKIEVLKLSALALLFFLAVQAFETRQDWRAFAWFLLVLGFAVSVFGIIQHYAFNGKLYWFRQLRYGGIPFGPYVNRNHFAGLLELIIPVGLSILLFRAEDRDRWSLVVLLTIVPVGALFLSASRGGITAFLLEVGLVFIFGLVHGEGGKPIVTGALVLLAAGAFIVWLGAGRALERFEAYQKLEVSQARRAEMLQDTWRIFLDHALLGTGLGTLEAVFPQYETLYDGTTVNHAHNDYVELLAETGAIGGLICACFLVLLLGGAWRRIAAAKNAIDLALYIGALSACGALLAHSLVDFNLHIPSNALLFLLQSALATSIFAPAARHRARGQGDYSRKLHRTRAVQTV